MTTPLRLAVRRADRTGGAMAVEVSLRLPSAVDCVEEAVELLARHCFAGGRPSRRAVFRFRVALAEALANAIVCGNGEDAGKGVEVRAECLADEIRVHVTDEGPGFDPHRVQPPLRPEDLDLPCGRGLFLIRNLVDRVEFNERGNSICMTLPRR